MLRRMKCSLCLWLMMTACLLAAEPTNFPPVTRTNTTPAPALVRPDAFKGFLIKKGFRLDLMAAEPLLMDPVAMAFDENGRLFVLESPRDAVNSESRMGRLRLLQDVDGDGVFDKSTIYAVDLPDPGALICYEGGVYVSAGEQILYLRDSRGGGVADVRREVYRGFGEATNGVQGRVIITSMVWGLDNRIHVGTAGHGGDVFSSNLPKRSVVLTEGNFAFDPRTQELTPETGVASAGMCFDSRGRKYVSMSTEHIVQVMYESRYSGRNPLYTMPGSLLDIAPEMPIFPARGAPGAAARFSTATGLMIYRGNAFPVEYWENAFTIDSAAGVVHRDKLRTTGIEMFAERAADESGFEFLSLKEGLFQPTQLANAPDGTLYIAGVVREPPVARKTNAPSAALLGRILRVAPLNFKQPAQVQLSNATPAQLVALLRHPNGWQRDTAARLLYQRQDKAAILPLAQLALETQASPVSRIHALHALAGMQALAAAQLARVLTDADERVREHAVLLAEKFIGSNGNLPDVLSGPLISLAGDVSPRVRYQVAFTLGQVRHPARNQALADCLRRDPANRWLQAAVMSSAGEGAGDVFGALAADGNVRSNEGTRELLRQLVQMIGSRNQPMEATTTLNAIQTIPEAELAFSLALALSDGLQRVNSSLVSVDAQGALRPLYTRAIQLAGDANASETLQLLAIRLLETSRFADVQVSVNLLERWPGLSTLMRLDAVVAMLARPERAAILMTGLERGIIRFAELTSVQIRFLLSHRDPIIRARALAVFGAMAVQNRQQAVNRYLPALRMGGTAERGHGIFQARCAVCHQIGGDGNPIGMELVDLGRFSREQILIKILDPNRNLPRNSAQAIIETKDGSTLMGFISEQGNKSITLCQPNGAGRVVGRQNIVAQDTLGISAMPEGLETGLNSQDLADLIEYLKPNGSAPK